MFFKHHSQPEVARISHTFATLAKSIHLGLLPDNFDGVINREATKLFWTDETVYRKQALEWAKEDNCGFRMVQFEDLRLKAIQSVFKVPNYECHFFVIEKVKHDLI